MNNFERQAEKDSFSVEKRKGSIGKIKEIAILLALALALIIVAWAVFHAGDSSAENVGLSTSEKEQKIIGLLQQIDGVGEANVVVCEGENGVESVVVVCEGANDFQVVINVRGAVAAALGTDEKSVKIYLKN